jgi:hypothetical protein
MSVLVIGQQPGDGTDAVVECVAAAEVSVQGTPVLHVRDSALDPDSPTCVRFPLRVTKFYDARDPFGIDPFDGQGR